MALLMHAWSVILGCAIARNKFSYNESEIAVSTRTYWNEYDVLTETSTRTYWNEYDVLTETSTRTHDNEYAHSLEFNI